MMIFKSWSDSCALFAPSALKLFLLVTFKSVLRVYTLVLTRWWPLIIGGSLLAGYAPAFFVLAVKPCMILLFILLARPSVQPKEAIFMARLAVRGFWLLPLYAVISAAILYGYLGLWIILMMPLLVFFSLGVLDSYARPGDVIYAAVRAVKMLVLNAPFCLISAVLFYAIMRFLVYPVLLLTVVRLVAVTDPAAFVQAEMVLMMPLMICFFVNVYTKKIYEQFTVYR